MLERLKLAENLESYQFLSMRGKTHRVNECVARVGQTSKCG